MSDVTPSRALPMDPGEGRQIRRLRRAKWWIDRLAFVWLVAHGLPYLLLFVIPAVLIGPGGKPHSFVIPLLFGSQILALFAAGAAAVMTVRNWSTLPWPWIVAGLFPWTAFLAELTVMYGLTLL
jgi:hypothetical protein